MFTPVTQAGMASATIEVLTLTTLRCACEEYRVNHFCAHLVYYTVAKIQAHEREYGDSQMKGGETLAEQECKEQ